MKKYGNSIEINGRAVLFSRVAGSEHFRIPAAAPRDYAKIVIDRAYAKQDAGAIHRLRLAA